MEKCKYQTNEIEYLEANVKFEWVSRSQGTALRPSVSGLELVQVSGVQGVGLPPPPWGECAAR